MKQTLLILFAAACFSSCTVNYCNHDNNRSNKREPTSEEAFRQRMSEMPTSTNVSTRTNMVSYNSTPVVRTYYYSAPAPVVTYRRYYYSTNCAPIIQNNCTSTFRLHSGSTRYRAISRNCTPVVRRHRHY